MIVHDVKLSRRLPGGGFSLEWSAERHQYEIPDVSGLTIKTLTTAPLVPDLLPLYAEPIPEQIALVRYVWFQGRWELLAIETNYDSTIGPKYTVQVMPVPM